MSNDKYKINAATPVIDLSASAKSNTKTRKRNDGLIIQPNRRYKYHLAPCSVGFGNSFRKFSPTSRIVRSASPYSTVLPCYSWPDGCLPDMLKIPCVTKNWYSTHEDSRELNSNESSSPSFQNTSFPNIRSYNVKPDSTSYQGVLYQARDHQDHTVSRSYLRLMQKRVVSEQASIIPSSDLCSGGIHCPALPSQLLEASRGS